ncbi:unnamed protein product [Anisakis simplex]|uniref:Dehydrogenase/reductase SDR family member 1 (inferred by orthology to a human protein) n=1 Tax=Anisakis simplex TaxID=6269 RepID=A0A0M3IZ60_ANISI|nr:unnamed protein product [Anisakis simplex]
MSSQPLTDKPKPLSGRIAIVTGASRGIGKGIAVQLGEAGAKVYITGREPSKSYAAQQEGLPSLNDTAEEIKNRGGEAVLVYCDHSNPDDVKKLFDKVASECDQKLDILVNCAFSGAPSILEGAGKKFYDFDPLVWDEVNNVGLRNVYICCVYAARLMVPQKRGLIVNISSTGGLHYFFNVVYGVGKAGMDRMATDMAVELKSDGICSVSLWPGAVKTELFKKMVDSGKLSELSGMEIKQDLAERFYKNAETPEFVGRGVVALACDENVMKKSGRILLTSDLGQEYGFVDIDGECRSIYNLCFLIHSFTADFVFCFINQSRKRLN